MSEVLHQSSWLLVLAAAPLAYILWNFVSPIRRVKDRDNEAERPRSIRRSSLAVALANVLPECVFFADHPDFTASLSSYWSQQNREIVPECVVRPLNDLQLSTAVTTIKSHFDQCVRAKKTPPTFAIRSGGHSTVPGASNAFGGIVIDLGLFDQVVPSEDRRTVSIGCGARWGDVSRKLDSIGLAVAGGRNSDVGVGGLVLGGGYSYFSPQCGFACDNVIEFHLVLASGEVTVASEQQNPQLWRALQGGGNNFAIVTRFTMRAFACSKVWSGFLYMWSWKAPQVIRAFYEFVNDSLDDAAAGPLLCTSYVQQIGITLIATHLMYTKPEAWPTCWSGFRSIGRIWSSNKVRSLTNATDELDSISPAGFRQLHISTTVKNDLATLEFTYATFAEKRAVLKSVKGMVWTLVIQPLHTSTMSRGKHNVLGLSTRTENLVVVLFTAVWKDKSDDLLVNSTGTAATDEINKYAADRGTADNFRYLNWCDVHEHPFVGYGKENLEFLKDTSRTFDPDQLFQQACVGGFKLAREDD